MSDSSAPEPDVLTTLHVHRMVDGDAESLEWVVSRFTPLLLAQAQYHTRGVHGVNVEDLVNDAWADALPKLVKIEPGSARLTPAIVSFLSRTLLFVVKNELRKTARRGGKHAGGESMLGRIASDATGVVSRAIRAEQRGEVMRSLDRLDPMDRDVVVLRGIEQRSNQTAGMLLGVPAGTVAARYSRALKKLREGLVASVFDELGGD